MSQYYIRKNQHVLGPFPKEEIARRVHLNLLTSLDEIKTIEAAHWDRVRNTPFWTKVDVQIFQQPEEKNKTKLTLQKNRQSMSSGFSTDGPSFSSQASRPTPQASAAQQRPQAAPPPLRPKPPASFEEKRDWALPTYKEEMMYRAAKHSKAIQENVQFSFLKLLFGGLFSFHSTASVHSVINGDGKLSIEALNDAKTWIWPKVFLLFTLSSVLLFLMIENPIVIPTFIFISSLTVPISLLVFFLECDISRMISAWRVALLFLLGGILSFLVTTLFHFMPGVETLTEELAASVAGLTEEPAKAIILLPFICNEKRYPYILNGLLLGATVGAGFAAFETVGYVHYFGVEALIIRSLLTPFMHIAWTAAIGGALWMARGKAPLSLKTFFSPIFLGVFLFVIGLHMFWNGLAMQESYWLYLGGVVWIAIVFFIKRGFAQIAEDASL